MNWWQMAAFAFGTICTIAAAIAVALAAAWRGQEKRDGLHR